MCVLVSTTLSLYSALLLYPLVTSRGVDEGTLNEKELNTCFRVNSVYSKRFVNPNFFRLCRAHNTSRIDLTERLFVGFGAKPARPAALEATVTTVTLPGFGLPTTFVC